MTGESASRSPLERCVHCGFCLPACPTYALWGAEADSPRGRIHLVDVWRSGRAPLSARVVEHFDRCLGCLACVSACPSGVDYGALIEATRAGIERDFTRRWSDRLLRRALFAILPYPRRLRLLTWPLRWLDRLRPAMRRLAVADRLPARVRALIELAPPAPRAVRVPARTPAQGERRRRVGLLAGCVQQVLFAEVNRATVAVLAAEGCDVVVPAGQGCCGALAQHAGLDALAQQQARATIAVFDAEGVEEIVVNVAGCGSAMKHYGRLLAQDPRWARPAEAFAARVRDVSEALVSLGAPRAARAPLPLRVAYHDACHLSHGQGVREAPRTLLRSIPGISLVSIADADMCCGSAGIYNLVQPTTARILGDRKVGRIAEAAPDVVATGNAGCLLQLRSRGQLAGHTWLVVHPIELLDASISGRGFFTSGLRPEPPRGPRGGP